MIQALVISALVDLTRVLAVSIHDPQGAVSPVAARQKTICFPSEDSLARKSHSRFACRREVHDLSGLRIESADSDAAA